MNRRQALRTCTAAASVLAAPTLLLRQVEAGGPAAYQGVWDADQSHRGLQAIGPRARGSADIGFVRVDERGNDPDHRVIAEVVIPEDKRLTYDLTKALLDNYRLDQTKREDTTQPEAEEMLALIEAVTDSAPDGGHARHSGRTAWRRLFAGRVPKPPVRRLVSPI